jgi:hypothetical protein
VCPLFPDEGLVSFPLLFFIFTLLRANVTRKLIPSPPLLLIFFHDKGWLQPNPNSTPSTSTHSRTRSLSKAPSTISSNFEFLLFSYLLRFIHREGKTGDFARAGLLFLFDIAFPSEKEETITKYDDSLLDAERALASYILDGDFVDVMAAGLGAVWSLLPSKLKVPGLGEIVAEEDDLGASSGGMVLGAHELERNEEEMRMSTDEDVRNQIGMLLKLFGYVQDILVRRDVDLLTIDMDAYETESDNSDPESEPSISRIWGALIEASLAAIQSSFLENVLYPSILECSSHDGSSVAIMTYLIVLFSNMDDGSLLTLLMDYLLCRGKYASENEDRFTMKDLIIDNINSGNAGAITAGLKLLGTMMGGHCDIATGSLLSTISPGYTTDNRQPIPNSNELEFYASLVERLDHTQSSLEYSSSYASYLTDTHACIQNDKCFQLYQLFQSSEKESPPVGKHKLESHNIMLQSLLGSLGQFLCRGADENVALTGVIVTMAICPFRSLEGWLTFEPDLWAGHDNDDELRTNRNEERPAIYQILANLVSQIATFRSQIPNFDNLLAERRSGLLYSENIDEAMNVMLDVEPSNIFGPTLPITPTPKKKGVIGTLASYLTPTRASASPSPAATTPQRPLDNSTTSTNPYKAHYETLAGKEVEAVPSPIGKSYISTMALNRSASSQNTTSTGDQETVAPIHDTMNSADKREAVGGEDERRKMSLNTTLDNCIILEEFIKELVAVISARRGLGIDPVSFI